MVSDTIAPAAAEITSDVSATANPAAEATAPTVSATVITPTTPAPQPPQQQEEPQPQAFPLHGFYLEILRNPLTLANARRPTSLPLPPA
jgi:hypothetical protein